MAQEAVIRGQGDFHALLFEVLVSGPGVWGEVVQKMGRAPPRQREKPTNHHNQNSCSV